MTKTKYKAPTTTRFNSSSVSPELLGETVALTQRRYEPSVRVGSFAGTGHVYYAIDPVQAPLSSEELREVEDLWRQFNSVVGSPREFFLVTTGTTPTSASAAPHLEGGSGTSALVQAFARTWSHFTGESATREGELEQKYDIYARPEPQSTRTVKVNIVRRVTGTPNPILE